MTVRIGLVVEGPTDFAVIEALITARFRASHPELELQFVEVQPSPDATSGSPGGGWSEVMRWCIRFPPEQRQRHFLDRPLLAQGIETRRCDVLLVILDADASDHVAKHSHLPTPPPAPSPEDRGDFIRNTLVAWLWPDGRPTSADRHVVAAAVEAVETWIVAALGADHSPENIADIWPHFVRTVNLALRPNAQRGVKKKRRNYAAISQRAVATHHLVPSRCPSFRRICEDFEALIEHFNPA